MLYTNITYFILAVFLIYKFFKKDFNLFSILIFVIPFHTWKYNIGLNLTVYQIVIFIMIIAAIYKSKNLFYFGNKYIIFFLFYAMINSSLLSFYFIDDFRQLGGFFRSEGRFIAQIILLLITFSMIPLAFNFIKNNDDIYKYFKIYIYGLITLVILGWIQFIIFKLTHVDIFPLGAIAGLSHSGMWGYDGITIFRMSSLAGEPKTFSISLVIGFFIISIFNRYNFYFFKYDLILKYLFLFTSFATLSTSGIVLFIILYIALWFYQIIKSDKKIVIKKNIFSTLIIFSIIGILIFQYWDFISLIIEKRIFERDVLSEDFDAPIQKLLVIFPEYLFFGLGVGNAHNFAFPYIAEENLFYMEHNIFVAKSGYLRIISELGLIGFILFIGMVYVTYRKLGIESKNVSIKSKNTYKIMQGILMIIMLAYFARGSLLPELVIFIAISTVLAYSRRILKGERR